ncbi:DEAD/DEAH box helicase [Myxococcus llanfairpwllgwyngyllgogerychwyrndrobwllllantysiliogogogochensis]|uniref:DEAD/DEAH box helicase n=1 Tax=Myxococcus llanfairpwllgwyngyllgogerychwyrndrobwllllantysiliogogogochensis TaxID=2590453 RepID=A0A540X895_9BACT|nr:DEAD/DEAH box helicase [Myxococcus llanfairpwllgwyngyllgogerychwyrndrobwllllantysiliogogogochensis]TQF17467.1 DEAD/DEAH box helicase [Myxococcus llanfairpwllgwyngyllgogerychwyrndrobwllllantysiliogogogochensis]
MSAFAKLLEAVRKEARPGLWSKGVGLARDGAVVLQSKTDSELELRVRSAGRPVPFTVALYPADDAWECDCPSLVDPCEHVVAAAISLQQAEREDAPMQTAATRWSRIAYHFTRTGDGLQLKRTLAHADGKEEALEGSLTSYIAKPAQAAKLQVEQADLLADRILEQRRTRGTLNPETLDALLKVLVQARNVLLDGRPVAIPDEVVVPRALVEERGGQLVVTVARDSRVSEVVSPGVARVGDALARMGETGMTGPWLQNLPIVRTYSAENLGELTSKVLPELGRRMPVEVRTKRVPSIDRELKPRILLELNQLESGLSVLPTLVYGAPPTVRIDNGKMVYLRGAVPLRDEAVEQRLIHDLREELNLVPGRRVTVQGPEMVRWADRLRRWGGDLAGDGASVVSPDVRLRPSLSVESAGDGAGIPQVRFTLEFQVEGGKGGEARSVDAAAVVRAWQEGLGLVPLVGGGWAPLPRAWLDKHGQRVADLLAARQPDGRVSNHALPQLSSLCETLEQPPPPGLDKLAPLVEGFEKLPPPVLPDDLNASLRHYQQTGVSWLGFLKSAGLGGILADDMGLGKTLQTICVLGPRSLVVCPTSVLPNWVAELKRFRPSLSVCVYHGPGRELDPAADVTLTTYSILRLDAAALGAREWAALVLDEAQAIKNPESQVARSAFGLKSNFRLALSGTPLENRLDELWSLMHFTNPGLLGGRRQFEEKVSRPISEGNAAASADLRRRIRPFVLRRLKRDVAPELPPRIESVMHVSLDERERSIYDSVMAATRKEVVALLNEGGSVLKALEALLRLRQAACHPALVPGQKATSSSKVETLVDALDTAVSEGHKALVFSQWTSLLDLIEPALKQAGIGFDRLDGTTVNRGDVTSRFQSEDGPPVLLMSLKAGGTGLNLTAADHVFLVDPWWNPAVEAQAADRAHRIGQERPVNVYRLVSQGTVEERILGLQDKKRALMEAALSEAAGAAAITREDLLELFS